MNSDIRFFYIALFLLASIFHLYASFKNDKKIRAFSKPILIPSLLFFYLSSVSSPSVFVILALCFSWLGDLFLIPKGLKWFTYGGISFIIAHIFLILAYSLDVILFAEDYFIFSILIFGFFLVVVSVIYYNLRFCLKKQLRIPVASYLVVNGLMNCFAILRLLAGFSLGNLIIMIGAISFFVSDSILFFVRFDKNCKIKSHFWVMISYLLGEALIVLGFIL